MFSIAGYKSGPATLLAPSALRGSAGGPFAFTLPLGRPASTQGQGAPKRHRIGNVVTDQSDFSQVDHLNMTDQSEVKDWNK